MTSRQACSTLPGATALAERAVIAIVNPDDDDDRYVAREDVFAPLATSVLAACLLAAALALGDTDDPEMSVDEPDRWLLSQALDEPALILEALAADGSVDAECALLDLETFGRISAPIRLIVTSLAHQALRSAGSLPGG